MSTCGYVCPLCEGKGFLEDGTTCDWCVPVVLNSQIKDISNPKSTPSEKDESSLLGENSEE